MEDINAKKENGENNENLNKSFFSFIECFSETNQVIYEDLLKNKESMSNYLQYSIKIINFYLLEKENKNDRKNSLMIRIISKNIQFLIKTLNNINLNSKNKSYKDEEQKIITKFFIIFTFSILNEVLKCKKNKDIDEKNKEIKILNKLLKNILYIIGKLYLKKIINDENFELLLKIFLIFSITKSIESIELKKDEKYEIKNFMFFNNCINLIKIIFMKLIKLQNEFTQRQEEIINNIIIFIKDKMLDSIDKSDRNSYINKIFLSKNDSKTTLLIDLIFIISKTKSKEIVNNFINLLNNIYIFNYGYENVMSPMLKQLAPLFTNIQNKDIKKMTQELNISDFPIELLSSLINEENAILRKNSCFLKQGFYLGNETCGISCNFNSLENEFIILFGLKLEKNKEFNISLFNIKYIKDKSTQIKFYLKKTNLNADIYEMLAEDKRGQEFSLKINISPEINYIFGFHFKIGGIMHSTSIKVHFIKDKKDLNKEDFKVDIKNGNEIKIKNFKSENFSLNFGYDEADKSNKNFRGFLGDIIIINSKNIKNYNIIDINNSLLTLEGKYSDILPILEENFDNNIFISNKKTDNENKNFQYLKEKIKAFGENENKLFDVIRIISSNSFKLIDYQDEIDYIKMESILDDEKNHIYFKKKYTDLKMKSDSSEDEKIIKIYSSSFNKNFHIFKNESTFYEFLKYDGIDYLSLLMEYYYQIINQIYKDKNKYNENDIKEICEKINQNILKFLNFLYQNFIEMLNYNSISKLFYQIAITLLKLLELYPIHFEIIKFLSKILDYFDFHKENGDNNEAIKMNLFDFLLNPDLYQEKDEKYMEKLNYSLENILKIVTSNSLKDTYFMKKIFNIEFLDKLLSFIWLFNDDINNINDNTIDNMIDNKDDNEVIEKKNLFFKTSSCYYKLLLQFLQYYFNIINEKNNKKNIQKELNQINIDNKLEIKNPKSVTSEEKNDGIKDVINHFFDEALLYRQVNYNIFSKMLTILYNANLIEEFDVSRINEIKKIIRKELKNKDEKDKNNLIFISCLRFLICYYFTENKGRYKEQEVKNKEKYFHLFLRNVNINLDFFYSLISILKEIKSISKNDIQSFIPINETKNNEENENNNEPNIKDTKNKSSFSPLPILDIDFKNLSEFQIYIIKSIFEDIVFILYQMALKRNEINNSRLESNEGINLKDNKGENLEKEMYDTIKKNIDYIFRFNDTLFYQEIFSSDSEICAELYYSKWKFGINEGGDTYSEKAIMKYHKILLKNHPNPFIFKFYYFISNKNLNYLNNVYQDEMDEKINKTKIALLNFMVNTLSDFLKETKPKKETNFFYINNILNILTILNEELYDKELSLFKNNSFYEIFYKYISVLDKSCLLYSNYYLEIDNNCGKIISEVIYDIFFLTSEYTYKEQEFMKTFTKENKKEQEIFSIFYLIDIFKEPILEKEKKVNETLKKYIPDIDNLKLIHKNCFFKRNNKSKIKLFLDKKIYQIEDVNFSIYFLAKSFIYLSNKKGININNKFKKFLTSKFLVLLSKNIFRLYTKKRNFYGNKICQKFPLYSQTKIFIETYVIPNPNKFDIYDEFFYNDLPITLKEEYNIYYCYSSRLLHDLKKIVDIKKKEMNQMKIKEQLNNIEIPFNDIKKENDEGFITRASTFAITMPFSQKDNIENEENYFNDETISDISKIDIGKKEYFSSFEIIKKNNVIFNPKNYFFKIIFSEIYKNLIFYDNTFKLIKLSYFSKFRENNPSQETKQLNYPIKQRNFSNAIEPKIFIRKDFNFYNKKILDDSHKYLKSINLNKYLENLQLYKHNLKISNQKNEKLSLLCELITSDYIYFGKLYFFDDYLFFESEKDPRENNNDIEIFMKYAISSWNKDDISLKRKKILIYFEDINEIIKRRILYIYQSFELFHKNGKSYLFNFFQKENAELVFKFFNERNENILKNNLNIINNFENEIKFLLNDFRKGKISNYYYILCLNKYSTRTYNDLCQYPVFPWILKEYNKIQEILDKLSKEITPDISEYFRDMRYPMLAQKEESKERAKFVYLEGKESIDDLIKEKDEPKKFHCHFLTHYSSSAFIFYYLMRINPYTTNMIRLQKDGFENPNRMFNGFQEISDMMKVDNNDNREAIPDFYSYFDFCCNLNCCYFGKKTDGILVDDIILFDKISPQKNINKITSYVNSLYNNRKLFNDPYISKLLSQWVDIIFGKKQLPLKDEKEKFETYNIYSKSCYEQKTNIVKKIEKNYEKFKKGELTKVEFINKIKDKIDMIINIGMNVKQIMTETITYEGKMKSFENIYKINTANDDKYIYFNRINNDKFLLLKKDKKNKIKSRLIVIFDKNFKEKESKIYDCKSMYLMKNRNKYRNEKNFKLYNVSYAFTNLLLKLEKSYISVLLSCRYLDNYFRIHSNNQILNIFYEDFITCIRKSDIKQNDGTSINETEVDDIFYTGLLNGKLTEWKIIPFIDESNKTKKNKILYNFKVNELKHVYAHQSSITIIETYPNQNIIITAGEDKFINIRKIFDFELLTVIDLTYSFGNPIISKTCNIFPSLIKVSDLNLLYVLLYDYDNKKTIIRGYNLNGLYFAQTDKSSDLQINNISFTKNSNLVVAYYNSKEINVLSASDLTKLWNFNDEEINNSKEGTKMVEYNYKTGEFYILYDNEFILTTLQDKECIKDFESL